MGVVTALRNVAARVLQAPARPVRALVGRFREARLRERERIQHERMSEWNAAALWLHDQSACADDE
jgi:hypothetical protein